MKDLHHQPLGHPGEAQPQPQLDLVTPAGNGDTNSASGFSAADEASDDSEDDLGGSVALPSELTHRLVEVAWALADLDTRYMPRAVLELVDAAARARADFVALPTAGGEP